MSFSKQQASGDSLSATPTPLRNRSLSSHRSNRNPFLNLPIAGRLTLGFLVAALIAAIAAGATGVERVQSLNKEASFYQDLLQTNTDLNTGAIFLQLMSTNLHETLGNATGPNPSQETLIVNQNALQDLATRYNAILTNYAQHNLVDQHPDQLALLTEAGHEEQVPQQHTLAGSAVRTWQVYRAAQDQVLQDIIAGNLSEAQTLLRFQAEPTNADALSALRTLIQFEGHLAVSVSEAASIEEQNQLHTTLVAAVVACLAIALVGWFISNTIVTRLRQLRRVTQAVEQGELLSRVKVIGRDEIADVSLSVNTMLDTIVGLIQETRGYP